MRAVLVHRGTVAQCDIVAGSDTIATAVHNRVPTRRPPVRWACGPCSFMPGPSLSATSSLAATRSRQPCPIASPPDADLLLGLDGRSQAVIPRLTLSQGAHT